MRKSYSKITLLEKNFELRETLFPYTIDIGYMNIRGFPGGASATTANVGDGKRRGFHPWVRKIPWRGHGNPLQDACLENPMDRGAWWATQFIGSQSRT